jgi:hypothetical protein
LTEFVLDHEYAGDCSALGIEYQAGDNDYEIIVTLPHDAHHYKMIAGVAEYMRAVSNY